MKQVEYSILQQTQPLQHEQQMCYWHVQPKYPFTYKTLFAEFKRFLSPQ